HGVVNHAEGLLVWICEDIRMRIRVADEVVQSTAIASQCDELLNGNAAFVLDHALQATVDVAGAYGDAATELVLRADHELIRIFHADAGLEGFAAAEANEEATIYATGCLVQQVSRIRLKELRIIRSAVRIGHDA